MALNDDGSMRWTREHNAREETVYRCGPYLLARQPGRAGPSWRLWQVELDGRRVAGPCPTLREVKEAAEQHRRGG